MPDLNALAEYYRTLSDQGLLSLAGEDGFTDDAKQVLHQELARRGLSARDVKRTAAEDEHSNLREDAAERGGGYRMPGLQLFGKGYLNEADRKAHIQVRTKWFTISGIPLVPIASYRFKCTAISGKSSLTETELTVINRVRLSWAQVFTTWSKVAGVIIGAGVLIVGTAWILASWKH